MTLVVAAERLAQFGNAALPGIEGLAIVESVDGRLVDEIRAWQIAFADPKRQKIVPSRA